MPKRFGPYWTDARFALEVDELGAVGPRLLPIGRPFALVGRIAHADIRLDDRDVGSRHVYLHAEQRGLFAVDLATRTGTRFNGVDVACEWLRVGDSFEIAGRFLRLVSFEIDGSPANPPPCAVNLLADSGETPLVSLALEPIAGRGPSWILGSELAFVGRGDGCAIRLNQASISRTHCVLIRTARAAYVVDLPGRPTLVNGQPPRGALAINDGDLLSLGQVRFVIRVGPSASPELDESGPSGELGLARQGHDLARIAGPPPRQHLDLLPTGVGQAFPIDMVPPESQGAVLGWVLGALHASQSEILRRQDDLQHSLSLILQQAQAAAAAQSDSQNQRLDAIAEEIRRLSAQGHAPLATGPVPHHHPTPEPPRPPRDSSPAPEIDPARSLATAAWLLERIEKENKDNKFTLKSLFSRLAPSPPRGSMDVGEGEDSPIEAEVPVAEPPHRPDA